MGELPKKLSHLIRVGLADLRQVEADPQYIVHMGDWHYWEADIEVCSVCLAGCVLAKSLNAPLESRIVLSSELGMHEPALRALNMARSGMVSCALRLMGQRCDWNDFNEDPPDYDAADPEPFHRYLGDLADRLEAKRL